MRAGLPSVFKASGIPRFFYPFRRRSKSSLFFLSYLYRRRHFLSGFTFFHFFYFFSQPGLLPFLPGLKRKDLGWVSILVSFFLPASFGSPFWGDMGLAGSVYWLPFPALSTRPLISGSYRGFWVSILDSWVTILERISVY